MSDATQQATIESAQARVGAKATLSRGILRGIVTIRAYRVAYGRLEYLVESEHAEKQWVREGSLQFEANESNRGEAGCESQPGTAGSGSVEGGAR